MKKTLFLLLFTLFAIAANAQKQENQAAPLSDQEIRQVTATLTDKYKLNADQAKQMYTIQVRKQKNLASIAALQASDPALYRVKLQNVQSGTLASIRRILNTKEQVTLYSKTQGEMRAKRNKTQKEMQSAKAPKEAIDTALLAIYAE